MQTPILSKYTAPETNQKVPSEILTEGDPRDRRSHIHFGISYNERVYAFIFCSKSCK